MKNRVVAFLLASLLLISLALFCACSSENGANSEESQTSRVDNHGRKNGESGAEDTEKAPETEENVNTDPQAGELKVVSAERFSKKAVPVYDYNQDLDLLMIIDIPALFPETEKISGLNKEIYDSCKDMLTELKEGKEQDRLYSVGYNYGISNGIVSIILRKSEGLQASEWFANFTGYYYDASSEKRLSFDEYLSLLGLTKKSVYAGFRASAEYTNYKNFITSLDDPSFDLSSPDNVHAFAYNDKGASCVVLKGANGLLISYVIENMTFPSETPDDNENTVGVETAVTYTRDVKWQNESDKDNPFKHSIKVPKIVPETAAAKVINDKILYEANFMIDRLKSGDEGGRLYNCSYVSGVCKNVAAICTVDSIGMQASEWGVMYTYYFYDGNADKEITYDEYLSLLGFTKKSLYESFKKTSEFAEYDEGMRGIAGYSPDDENNIAALIYDGFGKAFLILKDHVGYASDYRMAETTLK